MSAFERRLAAIEAKVKQKSNVPVESPAGPGSNLRATIDAHAAGRPYCIFRNPIRQPATEAGAELARQAIERKRRMAEQDGPGARVAERLELLRAKMGGDIELDAAFDANRKATIAAIAAENRQRDKRRAAMARLFPPTRVGDSGRIPEQFQER
jgi:hypothetical protein